MIFRCRSKEIKANSFSDLIEQIDLRKLKMDDSEIEIELVTTNIDYIPKIRRFLETEITNYFDVEWLFTHNKLFRVLIKLNGKCKDVLASLKYLMSWKAMNKDIFILSDVLAFEYKLYNIVSRNNYYIGVDVNNSPTISYLSRINIVDRNHDTLNILLGRPRKRRENIFRRAFKDIFGFDVEEVPSMINLKDTLKITSLDNKKLDNILNEYRRKLYDSES